MHAIAERWYLYKDARWHHLQTSQVSRILHETRAFLLNSSISARYSIISRTFFCEVMHNFVC